MKISLVYFLFWKIFFPQNSESHCFIICLRSVLTTEFSYRSHSYSFESDLFFLSGMLSNLYFLNGIGKFHNDKTLSECFFQSLLQGFEYFISYYYFSICRLLSFGSGEFSSIFFLIVYSSLFTLPFCRTSTCWIWLLFWSSLHLFYLLSFPAVWEISLTFSSTPSNHVINLAIIVLYFFFF